MAVSDELTGYGPESRRFAVSLPSPTDLARLGVPGEFPSRLPLPLFSRRGAVIRRRAPDGGLSVPQDGRFRSA